jgi:hypothetical protein
MNELSGVDPPPAPGQAAGMEPGPKSQLPPLLVLVRDLMFLSRITRAAEDAGVPVKVVREVAALGTQPGRHLIVDLSQPQAVANAAAWRSATGRAVTGFVGHLDTETIEQARHAGIDRVLARGAFIERLGSIVDAMRDISDDANGGRVKA